MHNVQLKQDEPLDTSNSHTVQLLIHGQSVDASNKATFERISPIDGQVASIAAAATLADVDSAIASAAKAFPVWSKLSPTERR
ncbi:MAG TPA: aldehyde dehydrogenase family protein, partial [Acinetobacter sp.]|nr:aldehyde dehydrogenase family protein [Acinetobacter sp.]